MRYATVCSGIEAPAVAWGPLGWEQAFASEIEAFPSAVMAHHAPDVSNYGDMTNYREWPDEPIDLVCGGTPCQSFSVAGLRAGLDDPRGNLALVFIGLVDRYRPRWVLWENVPGVYSSTSHDAPDPCPPEAPVDMECDGQEVETYDDYDSDESHAFACFLAGLQKLGYGVAYRTLDAQWFRVAQRRRRCFVVAHLGDWRPAAAVLFEPESLRGDPAPSREEGEGIAPTVSRSLKASGGSKQDETHETYIPEVAGYLQERDAKGSDSSTKPGHLIPVPIQSVQAVREKRQNGIGIGEPGDPMFTMTARDQHAVLAFNWANGGGYGDTKPGHLIPVAFSAKDHGADAIEDCAPTLRAGGHDKSHANSGNWPAIAFHARQDPISDVSVSLPLEAKGGQAVAFAQNRRDEACTMDKAGALAAEPGAKQQTYVMMERGREGGSNLEYRADGTANALLTPNGGRGGMGVGAIANHMAVRRLTPRECERLMGFPDDYTRIPWRGKPASQCPDGPRYRALGNSMAVPVVRWIGERIQLMEEVMSDMEDAA